MFTAFNYFAVFCYGLLIMVFLLDIKMNKKNIIAISICAFISCMVMFVLFCIFGAEFLVKIYPFMIHLPLVLFFYVFFRKRFAPVLFVLCIAYVLTTPRKWLGDFIALFFNNDQNVSYIFQIIVSIPLLIVIYKYLRPAIIKILAYSGMKILLLTVIPFLYYIVAYITTVYSSLLYRSNVVVVGFLASCITYVFYAFLVTYFNEITKTLTIKNEQDIFKMQASATTLQLEQIRDLRNEAAIYRHDLRHHLGFINGCIENKQIDAARTYITTINNNIESTVLKRYCENETVNLILSFYISKAEKNGITVCENILMPSVISIESSDVCVILANGIENAIHAVENIADVSMRQIKISCHMKNNKLFIEIVNPFTGDISFANDIPQSSHENHGFGVKSIVAACEKYKGLFSFQAENNTFILRAVL